LADWHKLELSVILKDGISIRNDMKMTEFLKGMIRRYFKDVG